MHTFKMNKNDGAWIIFLLCNHIHKKIWEEFYDYIINIFQTHDPIERKYKLKIILRWIIIQCIVRLYVTDNS